MFRERVEAAGGKCLGGGGGARVSEAEAVRTGGGRFSGGEGGAFFFANFGLLARGEGDWLFRSAPRARESGRRRRGVQSPQAGGSLDLRRGRAGLGSARTTGPCVRASWTARYVMLRGGGERGQV